MSYEEESDGIFSFNDDHNSIRKFTCGKLNFDKYARSGQTSDRERSYNNNTKLTPFDVIKDGESQRNVIRNILTPS
jgi:hypothetical protein